MTDISCINLSVTNRVNLRFIITRSVNQKAEKYCSIQWQLCHNKTCSPVLFIREMNKKEASTVSEELFGPSPFFVLEKQQQYDAHSKTRPEPYD